jgi:hypothetical protein
LPVRHFNPVAVCYVPVYHFNPFIVVTCLSIITILSSFATCSYAEHARIIQNRLAMAEAVRKRRLGDDAPEEQPERKAKKGTLLT